MITGAELIRLQCYEGIEASQALYDWDFARQILHIRAVEAAAGDGLDVRALEESLFHERFLLERPILKALRSPNAVLLIDADPQQTAQDWAAVRTIEPTFQTPCC